MKTFRLIGMALVAVMMSANFVSCSGDDENESEFDYNETIVNEKRLKKVVIDEGDKYDGELGEFSYDYEGRLSVVAWTEGKYTSPTDAIYYKWTDNSVIQDDGSTFTFNIKDGLVTDGLEEIDYWDGIYKKTYKYTYNSSNRLIKVQETNHDSGNIYTSTCKWENDKLIEYVDEDGIVYKYTYSGYTCKGWYPFYDTPNDGVWELFEDEPIFCAHPDLIGLKTTQLLDKIETSEGDVYTYTYTLDEEGYVKTCVKRDQDEYGLDTEVTELTWE